MCLFSNHIAQVVTNYPKSFHGLEPVKDLKDELAFYKVRFEVFELRRSAYDHLLTLKIYKIKVRIQNVQS